MNNSTTILGIESSCDDTAVAIVTSNHKILADIVISQNKEHEIFQGVVPEIAARSHLANLEKALRQALDESRVELSQLSAIAATSGPGLIGGVIVGAMFGKTLASVLKKPFIAINHLEGHALTARLTHKIAYPYLLLLVSGGHCQFVAVKALGKYKILGQTIDDAVGEAFDKVAKMLGLPFPGGPEIEKRAKLGDPHKYILPKPIINSSDCNMSFSGLKTAVRTLIIKLKNISDLEINNIAASFQYTIGEILTIKTLEAIKVYEKIIAEDSYSNDLLNLNVKQGVNERSLYLLGEHLNSPQSCGANLEKHKNIVIAGGVAANGYLRQLLTEQLAKYDYELIAPPIKLCTDNAAMIAYAGLERFNNNLFSPVNFCPRARWSLEELENSY
ncbi:tRNA (adenosine(37)-N6)-threonylcarbamoyltransferase complex transferase subunit TsaD [Rickettsia endosymbiont of Halotydeus destructor]|uniref:tRNA (adenosine(37)-N6)-threonylcarbamoyltransferase complex transferase subunit TsaD n=1 Tax=Rickettsia endosymbiont of Halotydeus destructor TaxID=2996754 RepID=UPI003BB15394